MASVGFGSVGDIIAVAQLAYRVAQALSESRGATSEYQELIIELDTLAEALRGLDEIISRRPLDVAVRNAIKHAISRCWTLMTSFLGRIDGYKSSLAKRENGKGGNKWKAVWRSIGWMLFKKEELVELREKLSDQKATITLMLTLSQCASLSEEKQARDTPPVTVAPEPVPSSREELAAYIQQVIDSQRADTQKSYQEVLEAMKQTAQEQVPFNLQGYMDEFSKEIASEVRVLLGEVGQLREERRQLQHEVGELLRLRSQVTPPANEKSKPPPPDEKYPDEKKEKQDQSTPEQSSDYLQSLAAAQTELALLLQMKSKYGPGGEFDPDWQPPNAKVPSEPMPPPPPVDDITPPGSPVPAPAWRRPATENRRPRRAAAGGPPAPIEIPHNIRDDWASWQPSEDFAPSPPPEYSGKTSPGLFGPRLD